MSGEIDTDQLYSAQESSPYSVVDVREPWEYAETHVPGAINIPLGQVNARAEEIVALPEPLALICKSGRRSARAQEALAAQGIDAVNVTGGTDAWMSGGYPTEQGAGS